MIELSAALYLFIAGIAHATPDWVHVIADVGTDAGLLVFAALFAWNAWRSRGKPHYKLALVAPFGVIGAYLVSEVAKTFIQEERPCRAVVGALFIAECPAVGDWSFPSNHATIAAACAAVLATIWGRVALVVFPLAMLMAFSRVFVGVHYPHDVAAGFLVGATVGALLALLATRLVGPAKEEPRVPAGPRVEQRHPGHHDAAATERIRVTRPRR
ncbi:phosphatase PAP2 family protein [Umezawaea sp. Da 62-37]|uniref:phosphatase PAP2 family protein n=1 Tax=Umezawaea sp. Da 62-37 TaxID=3075927 RepID=UPI0028F73DBD|nr:phosphatase PAP2 family protein [Umezawaea sp. Da 62-37]WNV83419.1 phosphatase PAP2 family protein [Umezawaea sp. Da 62-37]